MAYTRRYVRKRRTTARKPARATRYRRKSGYYPRIKGRRPMSKRSVLNVTSKKKRNGMLTITTSGSNGTPITPAVGPAFVNAVDGGVFLWCATAQSSATATVQENAARTSDVCYMKGLSEHVRIQTSSGLPWFHRRICFSYRGAVFRNGLDPSPVNTVSAYYDDGARGVARWAQNSANNNTPQTLQAWFGILFKGVENIDWTDRIIAPVDTTRVDLKMDKTWTIQSGNANGIVRERKLWHPMNKNLYYDDDESGDNEVASYFSVVDKRGMGDYYIIDIIQGGTGGTTTDKLQVTYNSTLYWHEK